jgi:hemerythrin
VELIDSQHKELFAHVDTLLRAAGSGQGRQQLLPTVEFLGSYVAQHFVAEERLMDAHPYPGRLQHKAEHKAFVATYKDLVGKIAADGVSSSLVIELQHEVCDWLVSHVSKTDKALGDYITASKGDLPETSDDIAHRGTGSATGTMPGGASATHLGSARVAIL